MKMEKEFTFHSFIHSRPSQFTLRRNKRGSPSKFTRKGRSVKIQQSHTSSILLVDDKSEVRQMLRSILEAESFSCEEAENGAEALACLDAQSFALIITDIEMPVMDGLEFLHRLDQDKAKVHPPVIVLSGSQDEKEKRRVLELGAVAALAKPCNLGELLSAVNLALNRRPPVPDP